MANFGEEIRYREEVLSSLESGDIFGMVGRGYDILLSLGLPGHRGIIVID